MSPLQSDIKAHRDAWQAFQDAPEDDGHPDTIQAANSDTEAMQVLLRTAPADEVDTRALLAHLEWWVVEEAQREQHEPELFVIYAVMIRTASLAVSTVCTMVEDRISQTKEGASGD